MRTFKIDIYGFFLEPDLPRILAKRKMKNHKEARCLVTCLNGQDLFIKKNGRTRVSSLTEWREYWKKRRK